MMRMFLEKRNPWAELERLGREWNCASPSWLPAVNAWGNEDGVTVEVDIPGVEAQSLKTQVQENVLRIQGERKPTEIGDQSSLYLRERASGRFERALRLPFEVESEKVQAHVANGVLTIQLPRREASKPKVIDIEIK